MNRPFHRLRRAARPRTLAAVFVAGLLWPAGCVERTLRVTSEPQGALVYLNDQEVGRTPLTRQFLWYGTYDVAVRKEGYATLKGKSNVIAPLWQWVPFDLIAELLPFHLEDRHNLHYRLKPVSEETADPEQMVRRGQEMRARLRSGVKARAAAATRDAGR